MSGVSLEEQLKGPAWHQHSPAQYLTLLREASSVQKPIGTQIQQTPNYISIRTKIIDGL